MEVEDDNAELGITYAPCVLFGHSDMTLCIATHLPAASVGPVKFVAARYAGSDHPAAEAFAQYLLSSPAQSVFAKLGMEPVVDPAETAEVESLLVLAGAGLQPAMDSVADAYREKTGIRVDFSYAGSGMLLSQLHFSRRGDAYIPGESWWVDKAAGRDLIDKRAQVAYFVPVICVQKGNPKGIESISDLAGEGISVAIGDPEALAVGPVTQRIIERAGVKAGVMKNVALQAGCIPELANAVAMKTVDATIVWDATAKQVGDKTDIVPIASEYNEVAEVVFATLTTSRHPEAAADLMEYVASDDAADIIEEQGFTTTRPEGVRLSPDRDQGN
jgi:molybdate transport system substrate-binding protein